MSEPELRGDEDSKDGARRARVGRLVNRAGRLRLKLKFSKNLSVTDSFSSRPKMIKLSFTERRKKDLEKLKLLALETPELFERRIFDEDADLLESIGIGIPGKREMPKVLLKIFPSDFIVEEVTPDGRICTATDVSDGFLDVENGNFIHATVVKCGMSTYDVVNELSRILKCPPEKIQYAGIKDKWAITSQRISMPLSAVSESSIRLEDIKHEQFFFKDIVKGKGVVQPGFLQGNKFTILLRNESLTEKEKETIKNNLELRAEKGMANFFYLQRFRAPRYTNYHWAMLVLKGDYRGAVKLFLTERTGREMEYFETLREAAEIVFDDAQKLNKIFGEYPSFFETEAQLTEYLVAHPKDFLGALKAIEGQVQMWIYSLTSYFFNMRISSFLSSNMLPPKTLPIMLSTDRNDLLHYVDMLESAGIFPPPTQNLRHFRSIQMKHREVPTFEKVNLSAVESVEEGILLQFSLGKGQYATTYLAHAVTLANTISRNMESEKSVVQKEYQGVLEKFNEGNKARGKESFFNNSDSE